MVKAIMMIIKLFKLNNMLPNKIKQVRDVRNFFMYLLQSGLNFHPDTPFKDYVNPVTEKPTFNAFQARLLQKLMNQSFSVCQNAGKDIYLIAMEVFNGYQQSQGLPQAGDEGPIKTIPDFKNGNLYDAITSGELNKENTYQYSIANKNTGRVKMVELIIVSNGEVIDEYQYKNKKEANGDLKLLEDYGIEIEEA